MPCDNSYMDPTTAERDSQKICRSLVYVLERLHREVPEWTRKGAGHFYGCVPKLNEAVVLLCALCAQMSQEETEAIIYDGRDQQARRLADWWDKHQEADRKREAKEEEERQKMALVQSARDKLTPEEQKVIFGK